MLSRPLKNSSLFVLHQTRRTDEGIWRKSLLQYWVYLCCNGMPCAGRSLDDAMERIRCRRILMMNLAHEDLSRTLNFPSSRPH